MRCPHCQTENSEGASFCVECGQSLRTNPVCSGCGHTNPSNSKFCEKCGHRLTDQPHISTQESQFQPTTTPPETIQKHPTSFASGRYRVTKLLGEGNDKKVYLVHDTQADKDVAFSLLKLEKPETVTRGRITREAVAFAMLRTDRQEDTRSRIKKEIQEIQHLGSHPNIISVLDTGEHEGQPYVVTEWMEGGSLKVYVVSESGAVEPLK